MSQQESSTLAMPPTGDAEQRLAAERYRLVLESMGSMIFDHDFVQDSTFRSDSVAELFRWDQVEPTAEWWIDRIHPDDVERVTSGVYAEIARGPMERWEVNGVSLLIKRDDLISPVLGGNKVRALELLLAGA